MGEYPFSDFELTVAKDPLMIEAFGPCLPNNKAGGKFAKQILESRPN